MGIQNRDRLSNKQTETGSLTPTNRDRPWAKSPAATLAQTETGPGRKAQKPHSHKQRQALGEKPSSHTRTNRDRPWAKNPAATLPQTETGLGRKAQQPHSRARKMR